MVTQGGCVGWFKQRTNLEKTLLTLSCLLLLTLVIFILVGTAFKGEMRPEDINMEEIPGCWSTNCIKSAGQVLSTMDADADPCADFYAYACGGYGSVTSHSVAQESVDRVYLSIKEHLESASDRDGNDVNSLKSFYRSCMEFEGLHSLKKSGSEYLLRLMARFRVGQWPVLDDFYESTSSLDERLAALALLGVPVAFRLQVVPSSAEDGTYALKISPGGPLESGRSGADIRGDEELKTYMLFTFLLLGTSTNTKPNRTADEIRTIDAYYANIEQDTETNCDTLDTFSPKESLKMLNTLLPEMDWTVLFDFLKKEAGLRKDFAVELHCKAKIKDYVNHLKDQFDVIAQDYLGWRFYETFSKHIEPAPRRSGQSPRWKECVRLVEQFAAAPLLNLFTTRMGNRENARGKVDEVVQHVLSEAKRLVSGSEWLDRPKQDRILGQVAKLGVRIPFTGKNETKNGDRSVELPKVYGNYTAVVIENRRQAMIRQFRKLDLTVRDSKNYDSGAYHLTSESYTPTAASLAVHLNEVDEPYFRSYGPESWNYGGLGMTFARKFSQAFLTESLGVLSEDTMSVWDFWSSDSRTSSCLLNSLYEQFGMTSQNRSERFLKSLFVEASALEIASEGSKRARKSKVGDVLPGLQKTKDQQMVFLAYAQTMCDAGGAGRRSSGVSARKRLNAVLWNTKAFNKAFKCSTSVAQCPIWM